MCLNGVYRILCNKLTNCTSFWCWRLNNVRVFKNFLSYFYKLYFPGLSIENRWKFLFLPILNVFIMRSDFKKFSLCSKIIQIKRRAYTVNIFSNSSGENQPEQLIFQLIFTRFYWVFKSEVFWVKSSNCSLDLQLKKITV